MAEDCSGGAGGGYVGEDAEAGGAAAGKLGQLAGRAAGQGGQDCGVMVENYSDVRVGDILEFFLTETVITTQQRKEIMRWPVQMGKRQIL